MADDKEKDPQQFLVLNPSKPSSKLKKFIVPAAIAVLVVLFLFFANRG